MKDLLIRKVNSDDLFSIVNLIAPFVDQFAINEEGCRHFNLEGIQSILTREGIEYFIAEINEHLVGVIAYTKPYHLVNFFVAQDYQNKGIGRQLWKFVEELALQDNISEFTVNASCNALSVYKHLGFEEMKPVVEHAGLRYVPMKKIYNSSKLEK